MSNRIFIKAKSKTHDEIYNWKVCGFDICFVLNSFRAARNVSNVKKKVVSEIQGKNRCYFSVSIFAIWD